MPELSPLEVELLDTSDIERMLMAQSAFAEMADADAARLRTFAEYVTGAMEDATGAISEALRAEYGAALTQSASPVALEKAKRAAQRQVETIITQMAEGTINKVGQTVADGLAEGIGPRQIATRLTDVQTLDGPRAERLLRFKKKLYDAGVPESTVNKQAKIFKEKLLKERRETIARTEARYATAAARDAEAQGRGAKMKRSVSVGDDRVSDVCIANEALGAIKVSDKFTGGNDTVPHHPNCRCTVTYFTNKQVAERAGKRGQEKAQAMIKAREDAKAEAKEAKAKAKAKKADDETKTVQPKGDTSKGEPLPEKESTA